MYVRPTVESQLLTFGVSGKLWRDTLVMYDRQTRSLWSQLLGEAVAGPLRGHGLEVVPAEVTTWRAWKARHPETLVLRKAAPEALEDNRRRGSSYGRYHADPDAIGVRGTANPDDRMPGKTLVYGVSRQNRFAAIPFVLLEKSPVLNAEALSVPLVVFSPRGEAAAMVYERTVEGQVLTFELVEENGSRLTARDTATGSTWSWESGECLQGAFQGQSLRRLSGTTVYWGIWTQFHPETDIIMSGF